MKTKILLTILISSFIGRALFGQETVYKKFPVNVSLVYPVSIHGPQSVNYEYDLSFNILTGNTGSIDGFEIGGLLNMNHGDMSGVQIAGIGNMTNGNVTGTQIGGIFSLADSLDGLQINGIYGQCSEMDGLQVSGILNISSTAKSSIAGIANINTGDQHGIQIGGIYNQAKELDGVQIGLINRADTVSKGISIGLINLIKKGHYDEWVFSVADYMNLGISYKLGLKHFYTIYSVGMNWAEDQLWVTGLGVGHLSEVSPRFSIQPEFICYGYYPMNFQRRIRDTYIYHFKFGLVRNLNQRMALSFAPSIYIAHKSNRHRYDEYGYEQSPINELFDINPSRSNQLEYGFGFSVGMHFR